MIIMNSRLKWAALNQLYITFYVPRHFLTNLLLILKGIQRSNHRTINLDIPINFILR